MPCRMLNNKQKRPKGELPCGSPKARFMEEEICVLLLAIAENLWICPYFRQHFQRQFHEALMIRVF